MSRPTQEKMSTLLREIEDLMRSKRVKFPYDTAVEIGSKMDAANHFANEIARFVENANRAFEALEGLLANWPTTNAALTYEPEPHRPVLMTDKAIEQAADVLKKYREIEGDFTW